MSQPQYFHFTLGPVQGFVAQARRTRDFWAGSFILSWLSAVAMKSVMVQNGTILFPEADPDFLSWLEGKPRGEKPVQGSVPNRFKAEISADIIETFNPQQVEIDIQTAWQALAELVYQRDLQAYVNKHKHLKTRDIWNRQINHFWEISWAMSDDIEDSALLDQRKNWRTHLPPAEPGVKCMMMDGLQELSGTPKPNDKELDKFWKPLWARGKQGMKSDLREQKHSHELDNQKHGPKQEHLCAVAFVKRRFVRYFDQLKDIEMSNGWALSGWSLPAGVPSVTYMAAVHWLEQAALKSHHDASIKQKFWAFHDAAHQLTHDYGEWSTQIKCIEDAQLPKKWKALDGNVFFRTLLENENLYPDQAQAQVVIHALSELTKSVHLNPVTPFYAVLMMDGDSLGKQMSNKDRQAPIADCLAQFTQEVPDIVEQNNGFLVYAGGDDVLAILPLEDAMTCALALRSCYELCFKDTEVITSLSGAIEYAHIKMPLTRVLQDAHKLLDDIAKEGCGRDAIAVRVWKPGGNALEWAQPWTVALKTYEGFEQIKLEGLADDLNSDDDDSGQFSSQFFYKIRERLELLNPEKQGDEVILDEKEAIALMAAEYLSSGLCDRDSQGNRKRTQAEKIKHAEDRIRPLLEQCRPVYRNTGEIKNDTLKSDLKIDFEPEHKLQVDGALLVRFLAHKGIER